MTSNPTTGGLMVCGTASDSGKSTVVTALCRLLARQGLKAAPFKAQNMALNSFVTTSGHEIGRAQAAQAQAAGVDPEVAMNPILLKPTSDRTSQVIVLGRPWANLDAGAYQQAKTRLWDVVLEQLEDLRSRFDAVICEGAGSPAEINLLAGDIVNLKVAHAAGFPAVIVGDIDRGGVFAALYGTVALIPDEWRPLVGGFLINKFRGDPALLGDGPAELERLTGVPTLGVLPWIGDKAIDAEDSLSLSSMVSDGAPGDLDVAVVRFPRLSNFTDLDPLRLEPAVRIRFVDRPSDLGRPDLLILPGTKSTIADLEWLRATGLASPVAELASEPPSKKTTVLGICGGYQMMGAAIDDRWAVESKGPGTIDGLGVLPVSTTFHPEKITRQARGSAAGQPVAGYEIHHGRTTSADPWVTLTIGSDGASASEGRVLGTSLHGLFDSDPFRHAFLESVAGRAGKAWPGSKVEFEAARQARFDLLADILESHADVAALEKLLWQGRP